MIRAFLTGLPMGFARVFAPRYLVWHAAAIVVTYLSVTSGFDWYYFTHTRFNNLSELTIPAALLGFFLPIVVPVVMYYLGEWRGSRHLMRAGVAVAQSEVVGYAVTVLYKTFTGRTQPDLVPQAPLVDTSHGFHLGFLQNGSFFDYGLFWGWPSSHTTLAFAAAAALIYMYPKNRALAIIVVLYALYIGLAVSVSVHWFSEFLAGAILGTLVGVVTSRGHTTTARLRAVV